NASDTGTPAAGPFRSLYHLTIGAGGTIRTGTYNGTTPNFTTNQGMLGARAAGTDLKTGNGLINSGTVEAVNGASVTIGTSLNNSGTVQALSGGVLILTTPFTNTGTIRATDATIQMGGSTSASTLAGMTFSNAKVTLTGAYHNANAKLAVAGNGRTISAGLAGSIDGGNDFRAAGRAA